MLPVLALAAVVANPGNPLRTVYARDGVVFARDIANVGRAPNRVVVTLPRDRNSIGLSEERRRELLRAALPGGGFTLRQQGDLRVVRRAAGRATVVPGHCFVSRNEIAVGAEVTDDDLARAPCRREASRSLGYDVASRSVFARRKLPAGTYLGAVRLSGRPAAAKGQELVYRTGEGSVTVERKVSALQPGRAGQRIFVRTADGKVLVSTLGTADAK